MRKGMLQEYFGDAMHLYKQEEENFFSAAFAYERAKNKVKELDEEHVLDSDDDYSWMDDVDQKRMANKLKGLEEQYELACMAENEAVEKLNYAISAFFNIPIEIWFKKCELMELRYYFAGVMYSRAKHDFELKRAKVSYWEIRRKSAEENRDVDSYFCAQKVYYKAKEDFYKASSFVRVARSKYEEMKTRCDMLCKYYSYRCHLANVFEVFGEE